MYNSQHRSILGLLGNMALNSVLNLDPTRTTVLRQTFAADLTRRFRKIRQAITESIVHNDCFGLNRERPVGLAAIPRKQFAFKTSTEKVSGFMSWLEEEVDKGVLEVHYAQAGRTVVGHSNWEKVYIDSSYKKGMSRANAELVKKGIIDPSKYPGSPISPIDAMFNRPIHADRVGLLYTRTFNELKGITEAMDQQISRVLSEGMAQGLGPAKMARTLTDRVDKIGITRARTMARTEVIRAHHVATINTYREAQVEGVKVKAEWSTAGDNRVCPICEGFEGTVFTLDKIEGMIPAHPNCLLDKQIPIYTSKGWKQIGDIKVGDLVLTHKARFKKVIHLHRTLKQMPDAVKIHVGSGCNASRLSLTGNHPVLVGGGWIRADEITVGMKVGYLADKCKRCGKSIPWYRKYCSQTCISKDVTDIQRSDPNHRKNISRKASAQLKREYTNGTRDPFQITKGMNEAVRKLSAQGKWKHMNPVGLNRWARSPEGRAYSHKHMTENNPSRIPGVKEKIVESLKRTLLLHPEKRLNARMAKYRKSGSKTWIEKRMGLLLDKIGVNYVFQYPILNYDVDFAIPGLHIAIECDGEFWHQDKKKDQERQKKIENEGWFVLRFSGKRINQCLNEIEDELVRVVSNHTGEFGFLEMEITKVERWKVKSPHTLYNLTVEDDESYIAHGFVVHNCRCCAIPADVGEVRKAKEATKKVEEAAPAPAPESSAHYEQKIKATQARIDKLNKETAVIEKQLVLEDKARIAARKREGKVIAEKKLPSSTVTPTEYDIRSKEFSASLTASERDAVTGYTGGGFVPINDALRDSKGTLQRWIRMAKIRHPNPRDVKLLKETQFLDSALTKAAPLDKDILVYRGLETGRTAFPKVPTIGDELTDFAFSSSSVSQKQARLFAGKEVGESYSGVIVEIRVPKGSRVGFARANIASEQEVLFPRFQSKNPTHNKFRVVDVEWKAGKRKVVVECEPVSKPTLKIKKPV